jgi:hypothetical protein
MHEQALKPLSFVLHCSKCDFPKQVANITLLDKGKWHPLVCRGCAVRCTARLWKCECGHPWLGCPKHAAPGLACLAKPRNKRTLPSSFLYPNKAKYSDWNSPPTCNNTVAKEPNSTEPRPQQGPETSANISFLSNSINQRKRAGQSIPAHEAQGNKQPRPNASICSAASACPLVLPNTQGNISLQPSMLAISTSQRVRGYFAVQHTAAPKAKSQPVPKRGSRKRGRPPDNELQAALSAIQRMRAARASDT